MRGIIRPLSVSFFYLIKLKIKVMKEALKVIFLFKKPTWDDYRLPYILLGIIGWLEIISIVIVIIN